MIKYKGTTLYPPAMNDILNDFGAIDNYLIQIYTNDLGTDEIVIKIAVKFAYRRIFNRSKRPF
jgi:phenylacetate-CoA ligase